MIAPLALLFASSVLAGPALVPSHSNYFLNATAAKPTGVTTLAGACDTNCSYSVASARQYTWTKVQVTATVTYAVAYVVINNRTNTTRTSTSFVALPSGYTLPPTNAAGTHVEEWVVTEPVNGTWSSFTTNITYPSMYTSYPSGYDWWGIVPTTASSGETTCSWAPWYFSGYTTSTSTLSKTTSTQTTTVISYHTVASGASVNFTSVQPFGPNQPTPDAEDPQGFLYTLDYAEVEKLTGVPPGNTDGVIQHCTFGPTPLPPNPGALETAAPAAAYKTASFLIATSTIHEDSGPSSSSSEYVLDPKTLPTLTVAKSVAYDASLKPLTTTFPEPNVVGDKSVASETSLPNPESTVVKSVAAATTLPAADPTEDTAATNPTTADLISGLFGAITATGPITGASSEPAAATAAQGTQPAAVAVQPSSAPVAAVTAGGIEISQDAYSNLVAGGQTLQAGSSVILGSGDSTTAVVLQTNGGTTQLAVGGSQTFDVPSITQAPSTAAPAVATLAGATVSQNENSDIVVGGQTLQASAGSAVTVGSGNQAQVYSIQTNNGATELVAGSSTLDVGQLAASSGQAPLQTVIQGSTLSQNAQGEVIVGSQTLALGSTVTIGSGSSAAIVQLQTSNGVTQLVADGTTTTLPTASAGAFSGATALSPGAVITVGGQTYSANSASQLEVDGQTLSVGGSSITLESGKVVALQTGSGGQAQLVVDGTTTALPTASAVPLALSSGTVIAVGGQTFTANSASQLVVDGQTLSSGSSITLGSGEVVALQTGSSGQTQLVVDGTTTALPAASAESSGLPPGAVITIGGQTFTANSASQLVVDGQTLSSGSSITLGSGEVVALKTGSSGQSQLVVDGTTTALPTASAGSALTPGAVITVGGQTFIANSASQLVIDGHTLTGGSITLGSGSSATVVGLQTAANGQVQLVVGDKTSNLPGSTSYFATTAAGATISRNAQSQIIVNGKTLTPGATITIGSGSSETTIALQTTNGKTALVVDGKTTMLGQSGTSGAAKTTSSSTGLGGAIISGLGGTGSGSATATGSAASTSSSGAAAPLKVVYSSSSSLVWMWLIWTLGLVCLI